MRINGQNIQLPINNIERVWEILKTFDIRPTMVQLEDINPEVFAVIIEITSISTK